MISISGVTLHDVQDIYNGAVGVLWELLMGEQIHIGGLQSSDDLAGRAGIGAGMSGVDLCCCTGAGMRYLLMMRGVASMTGIDATERVVALGRQRCADAGLDGRATFVMGDVLTDHLPAGSADFVWGEDAWCYVTDKPRLIAQAARLVKPGGVIAFTDWVVGPKGLTTPEAERFLGFMKFPNLADIQDYAGLLADAGCDVLVAEDTGRFAPCIDLYLNMVTMQHGFDALRIVGFDPAMMGALGEEMAFVQRLGHGKGIVQGLFVARKK